MSLWDVRPCLLCGAEGAPVARTVVRWVDPEPGREYAAVDRCLDRVACRARVEAAGERWEVDDGTLPPQRAAATLGEVFG